MSARLSKAQASPDTYSVRPELAKRTREAERILLTLFDDLDSDACILAMGGFGRSELFLHSDVDVLILCLDGVSDELKSALAKRMQSPVLAAFKCSYSVRTVEETVIDAGADLSLMTSLLDARRLVGNRRLLLQMRRAIAPQNIWRANDFFAAKCDEQARRHQRFSDIAYNLEPNVKDGPGGLRDIHTIHWLDLRLTQDHLLELLPEIEKKQLLAAENTLFAVRQGLHALAGRAEERVLFDFQPLLAEKLGYTEASLKLRIESLMQDYFLAVQTVLEANRRALLRAAVIFQVEDPVAITQEAPSFWCVQGNGLELAHGVSEKLARFRVLQAFELYQHHPEILHFGPRLASALESTTRQISDNAFVGKYPAQMIWNGLRTGMRVSSTLRQLAQTRILDRVIPAFGLIRGRMQHDLFHAYTVDEHSLRVVAECERFSLDYSYLDFPLFNRVFSHLPQSGILYLAALFHDIAKGRGGDHSELGAAEIREFARRAGISAADTDLLSWLVQEHLTMSTTSQRQDISDADVVRAFAQKVQSRERLDYLLLLTIADIRGTNPKLWNSWKAQLLTDLYTATRFALRSGIEQPLSDSSRLRQLRNEALTLLTGEGALRRQVEEVWQQFPPSSFARYSAEQIRWQTHALLAHRSKTEPLIALRTLANDGSYEMFVHAPDRAGLFASITTTLDRIGVGVIGARVVTSDNGFCFDTFALLDGAGAADDPLSRMLEIQMQLRLVLSNAVLSPRVVRRRWSRQQKHFKSPLRLTIEPSTQVGFWQLSLICSDRPSLLAHLATALFARNFRVHAARIATFGERVEDFFTISWESDLATESSVDPREWERQLSQHLEPIE
jgi:[protein-PII] uridylyltransferase